jgi:hypothetical protein
MVKTEINFGSITVKMVRADMLIYSIDTALQDAEETLCRVGMSIAPDIFILAMLDHIISRELRPYG